MSRKSMMSRSLRHWGFLAALAALVAATFGAWAAFNRPIDAPDITGRFFGAAYQPYRGDQSPTGEQPTVADIDGDLKMLSQRLTSIRTYSSLGPLDRKSTRLNSSHSQQSRMPSSA